MIYRPIRFLLHSGTTDYQEHLLHAPRSKKRKNCPISIDTVRSFLISQNTNPTSRTTLHANDILEIAERPVRQKITETAINNGDTIQKHIQNTELYLLDEASFNKKKYPLGKERFST